MPKCCSKCYMHEGCENKNECCSECDYFSDDGCLYVEEEEKILDEIEGE
jgi:hypothetical protein